VAENFCGGFQAPTLSGRKPWVNWSSMPHFATRVWLKRKMVGVDAKDPTATDVPLKSYDRYEHLYADVSESQKEAFLIG
jgi:hypothetical protein